MTTKDAIEFFEGCKCHCDNEEPINMAISALKTMSATIIRPKMLLRPSDLKKLKCELKEQMETGIVAENDIFDVLILDERIKEIQSEAISKFADDLKTFVCKVNCGDRRCVDKMDDECIWVGYIGEFLKDYEQAQKGEEA